MLRSLLALAASLTILISGCGDKCGDGCTPNSVCFEGCCAIICERADECEVQARQIRKGRPEPLDNGCAELVGPGPSGQLVRYDVGR